MKLKVAILEDNPSLLKDHKQNLEATELVDVVAFATNSTDFLNNENTSKADALLLDIDLGGGSNMNGLEVAYKLKLPVLFVSGHNAANLKEIEKLEIEFDLIVDHITKPFTEKEFIKKATKFFNDVLKAAKSKFVYLDFSDSKRNKISIDTIVFIETETGDSGASNNKRIYFTDRNPETLFNLTLSKIEDKGFDQTQFIKIRSSHRVNADKILRYNNSTHEIEVEVFKSIGKTEIKKLPVSENFRKDVSRFKK
jgi:DNA-binding LytR/AlgR family response regulator